MQQNTITIYHGSSRIIEQPTFGAGRLNNDFGRGFYCTQSKELAKEWAAVSLEDGYSNCYTLDISYMKVLNLNRTDYTILNWIAILIEHRLFTIKTPIARRAKQYLMDHFGVNVNAYDVIIGYRADDSYFDYAEAFLNNAITVEQLAQAMKLGKLGEQIVIKSEYAFSKLTFQGYEDAPASLYHMRRKQRDNDANEMYFKILDEATDGLYIQDIIRGGITNEDIRIPRNISPSSAGSSW